MQHGYKTQHYTVTALHTVNNTVAKGFNQMSPHARTITVALDISKAFDTINILIRKQLHNKIPCTIIKFIVNYIKGHKAYTTYRKHTSIRQFKTGAPQVVSSHPHYLKCILQTYHHPEPRFRSWPTQTTSPSHLHTQARVHKINTYNHTYGDRVA